MLETLRLLARTGPVLENGAAIPPTAIGFIEKSEGIWKNDRSCLGLEGGGSCREFRFQILYPVGKTKVKRLNVWANQADGSVLCGLERSLNQHE